MKLLTEMVKEHIERPSIINYPKRGIWATDCHICKNISEEFKITFGSCKRTVVMNMLGIGGKWEDGFTSQMSFDLGHWFENQWQEYFKEIGIWRGSNVKWYDFERDVSGEFDCVVDLDGEPMLVEFKTATGGFKFREIVNEGKLPENYIMQVGLYLYFGREIFKNGARLIYWIASDKKITVSEFEIDVDKEWNLYVNEFDVGLNVIDILKEFDSVNHSFENCIIPERGFWTDWPLEVKEFKIEEGHLSPKSKKSGDWQCDYCRHRIYCDSMPAEEISIEKFQELFGDAYT